MRTLLPRRLWRWSLTLVSMAWLVGALAGAPGPERLILQEPGAPAPQPDVDIVARFLARSDPPPEHYRARRHLEAANKRFSKSGWLDVITERSPAGFTYEVLAEGGSGMIRDRVLRAALEGERDIVRTHAAGAFDEEHYRLTADGVEGDLALIRVVPLRRDKYLIDGWLLVAPSDADLLTVRGRLSKAPSFWTTRVEIVRHYERINGVRVPVDLTSTASVRLAGTSTFRMQYDYETVGGVAVAR